MQLAHALSRTDVDGVLGGNGLHLVTGNKAKSADVFGQVFQGKALFGVGLQVIELKVLKVAHQHVTRQVALWQVVKIFQRLRIGAFQVLACTFHLDQQLAAPKHVDPAVAKLAFGAGQFDLRFIGRHLFAVHTKHVKEVAPILLAKRLFTRSGGIFTAKGDSAVADFAPT